MNRFVFAVIKLITLGRWPASAGRRSPVQGTRRVWRITDSKPEGEWVDPDLVPQGDAAGDDDNRTTLPMDSWATSSMDLRDGVHVVEHHLPPDDRSARPH